MCINSFKQHIILPIRITEKHSTSYYAAADIQATARHYTLEKFHCPLLG